MALAGVVPVGQIDRPVGTVLQLQPAEPGVVGHQKVGLVPGDVARAAAFQPVAIDALAVDVAREDIIAITIGPVVAQVDHRPDVGMAAAGLAVLALALARVGPAPPAQ